MKTTKQLFVLLLMASSLFHACTKDDNDAPDPTITGLEVGVNNNKTAHPGNDLHIEAAIDAPGTIATVVLEIHPETGDGWKVNTTYTENLEGLKNAEFHKHIDVPADAKLGDYHGHLKVTDKQGKVTEAEFELSLIADPTLPAATGFEIGLNAAGNDLHVEANLSATNKIAKAVVEVHGSAWEKETEFTDAAMVGQLTYHLHKHIDVTAAPKGHYHVHLKIVDQAGKESEFEEHFDKP
jgi:hypothetical protein